MLQTKRKRNQFTLQDKLDIITYHQQNPNKSHKEIANHFSESEKKMNSKILDDWRIFQEFLINFNQEMFLKNRKALLILDNCSAHTSALNQLSLTNVKIQFIRPNLTPVLQPCDLGVIRSFKSKYRTLYLEEISHRIDSGRAIKIDIKNAIYLRAEAWERVTSSVIINCWQATQIVDFKDNTESSTLEESNNIMELSFLISSTSITDPMNAKDFIDYENVFQNEFSKDSEIIERILAEADVLDQQYSDS